MARVTYDRICKAFGTVEAVRDLTLQVADGEFLVFVGPSGSGKTTALRILAGLETISSGRLLIDDRMVNNVRPQDRNIAMVFQDYALYPQMTVAGNLAFGLKMRKVPNEQIFRQVRQTAEMLDIGHLLDRKPAELSGGQRQRVALGRALVREPQVFLLDEPLSNLDAKLRAQTRGEIKSLQRAIGTTTIFVTHDQVEAMTMGDRIAVLNEGVLEQIGDPNTVYDRPTNLFVAGFIGSPAMTFIRCTPQLDGDSVGLRAGSLSIPLPAMPRGLPNDLILGVRPEHAWVWAEGTGLVGPLEGEVTFTEVLGRETFVSIRTPDGSRLTAHVDGRYRIDVGGTVRIGLEADHLYFFDAATERSVARGIAGGTT